MYDILTLRASHPSPWCLPIISFMLDQHVVFLLTWWVPRDVGRLSIEKVWDEHLVWALLVTVGENISSTEGLLEVHSEDVVDVEEGNLGILWTCNGSALFPYHPPYQCGVLTSSVGSHALDGNVFTLWCVFNAGDRWHGAAGV